MAVCKNKSILVSLGEDSVKVFNHTNEWEAHSTFEFEEQPLCIDLHPSGDQIAVGFKTGTRLYQHLDNELKLSFEKFGKATITIAYSNGGHLLATSKSLFFESCRLTVYRQLVIHRHYRSNKTPAAVHSLGTQRSREISLLD
jgi:hypothetical protein